MNPMCPKTISHFTRKTGEVVTVAGFVEHPAPLAELNRSVKLDGVGNFLFKDHELHLFDSDVVLQPNYATRILMAFTYLTDRLPPCNDPDNPKVWLDKEDVTAALDRYTKMIETEVDGSVILRRGENTARLMYRLADHPDIHKLSAFDVLLLKKYGAATLYQDGQPTLCTFYYVPLEIVGESPTTFEYLGEQALRAISILEAQYGPAPRAE